jgi:hypothetical protein
LTTSTIIGWSVHAWSGTLPFLNHAAFRASGKPPALSGESAAPAWYTMIPLTCDVFVLIVSIRARSVVDPSIGITNEARMARIEMMMSSSMSVNPARMADTLRPIRPHEPGRSRSSAARLQDEIQPLNMYASSSNIPRMFTVQPPSD